MSFRVDVDEEGVNTGDWFSREPLEEGEAVPSLESLFFLEDLLSPLPLERARLKRFIFVGHSPYL